MISCLVRPVDHHNNIDESGRILLFSSFLLFFSPSFSSLFSSLSFSLPFLSLSLSFSLPHFLFPMQWASYRKQITVMAHHLPHLACGKIFWFLKKNIGIRKCTNYWNTLKLSSTRKENQWDNNQEEYSSVLIYIFMTPEFTTKLSPIFLWHLKSSKLYNNSTSNSPFALALMCLLCVL